LRSEEEVMKIKKMVKKKVGKVLATKREKAIMPKYEKR
jgi:hypothetical protein